MSVDGFACRIAAANFVVLSRAVLAVGALQFFVLQPIPSLAESAYAFGQGQFGAWVSAYASNYTSQNEAAAAAMQKCIGRGIACSIIATFRKTCFAIAVQNGSNGWAVRYGSDIPSASRSALQGCAGMGQSCTVKDTFCDTISEQEIQQAAIDQANRDAQEYQRRFQEFQRQWDACFAPTQTEIDAATAISFCNQALTFPREISADHELLVNQRAKLQDHIQQIHDYDAYYAQQEACADYHEDACNAALRSPLADDGDRVLMRANLTLAQRFKDDVAACRSGSASACDAALMSSVARDSDRRLLEQWRAATPLFDRAIATAAYYWLMVQFIFIFTPQSTKITAAVAAALSFILIGVLVRQRRNRLRAMTWPAADSAYNRQVVPDRPPEPQVVPAANTIAEQGAPKQDIAGLETAIQEIVTRELAKPAVAADQLIASSKLDRSAIKRSLVTRRVEFEL